MIGIVIVIILSLTLIALLCIFGWFLVRRVWPYVTQQFEITRAHRMREQDQFISVLGAHAKAADNTRRLMEQMQEILSLQTGAIQRLADEVARAQKRKARVARPPTKEQL